MEIFRDNDFNFGRIDSKALFDQRELIEKLLVAIIITRKKKKKDGEYENIRNNSCEKRGNRRYRYLTLPVHKSVENQRGMVHFLKIMHAPLVK